MKTSVFVFLASLTLSLAVTVDNDLRTQFVEFQQTYKKMYKNTAEFEYRFEVFQQNLKKAAENQKKNPLATFGVTKFSDLTHEEFSRMYLNPNIKEKINYARDRALNTTIPRQNNKLSCYPNSNSYDWCADCKVCTGVYDQGSWGVCTAFSATETIESCYALSGGPLTSLSMQQCADCYGGGIFYQLEQAGGIESYAEYPYLGYYSGSCNFELSEVVVKVVSNTFLIGETGIYEQLSSASGGPVAIGVDADSWNGYTGGILTSCGTDPDHAVVVTGYNNYGQDGNYWIVRNSWGTDWGIDGFIWIYIGENLCDITFSPEAVVCTGV